MRRLSLKQKTGLILFGVFLCFLLLEIGLRIAGLAILSIQEYRKRAAVSQKGEYRIMCIGGSTTWDTYPVQLEEILNRKNAGLRSQVIDKGIPGINSAEILAHLDKNLDKYHPDMVICMTGINDKVSTIPYEDNLRVKSIMFLKRLRVCKLSKIFRRSNLNENAGSQKSATKKIDDTTADLPSLRVGRLKLKYLDWMKHGEYKKAEKILKKALEIKPDSSELHIFLGEHYKNAYMPEKAEHTLKKALELYPTNSHSLKLLGDIYCSQGRYNEAEEVLKKSIKFAPTYREPYSGLAICYRKQGKLEELEKLFKKIEALDTNNDYFYGALGTYYTGIRRNKKAENYYRKANELRSKYYNPGTRHNYQRIKNKIVQRGVKLVCVQYPVRSVKPLKKLFDSTEGIIFVGNEKIFKEALEKASYDEYFIDSFGGDFGHCTKKGNELMARNIADTILKHGFKKQ